MVDLGPPRLTGRAGRVVYAELDPHTALVGGALDAVTETRETYDVIARAYLERKRDRPWDDDLLDLLDRFCARVAPGARVADVGCGHGLEVEALLDGGLTALGVDLSPGMLACAAELVPGRLLQADLRRLPFADATLDGIWSVHALLHVPEADLPGALAELRRVLRPGAWAALSLAGGTHEHREEVGYWPGRYRTFVHWPLALVLDLAERAGLEVDASDYAAEAGRDTIWLLASRPHRCQAACPL